jgi:hypothetical protein
VSEGTLTVEGLPYLHFDSLFDEYKWRHDQNNSRQFVLNDPANGDIQIIDDVVQSVADRVLEATKNIRK